MSQMQKDNHLNPIIEGQLIAYRKMHETIGSDSDTFELLSIFAIENGLLGESIEHQKAHLKGSEFGIDGVAIIIQGVICENVDEAREILASGKNHQVTFDFFQSKTSTSAKYGEVTKFLDAVIDFFKKKPKLVKGKQIADLLATKEIVLQESTNSNPNIRCFFCTTGSGKVSAEIDELIKDKLEILKDLNIFNAPQIRILGASDIQNGYRAATNSRKVSIEFPRSFPMPAHSEVEESHIGYITADQLLKLAINDDSGKRELIRSVFYDNVRDFDPKSDINSSIIKEIEDGDLSSFVFKNNGVTVIAESMSRKSDTFTIQGFQIVNGCQTTNILAKTSQHANKISVPLRLICSKNHDFISKIIIGTNQQNEVREDQFWALRKFTKNLEVYCASKDSEQIIYIERRENQYIDINTNRTRVTKLSDLMKVVAAMFLHLPHRAARDARAIRKEFFKKIFLEGHDVRPYHAAALASYKFEYLVRNNRISRDLNIYKFYFLYALSKANHQDPNILEQPTKLQVAFCTKVLDIILNEDSFIQHINEVSTIINSILSTEVETNREKIRDLIRKDSFIKQFDDAYSKTKASHGSETTKKSTPVRMKK